MKKKISIILLGLSIASFAGMIATMIIYFINKSRINGIEFIEVAASSVKQAKEMLDFTSYMGWLTIILIILTVLLILATVVMFILRGRGKEKKNIREEITNESNQQSGKL